MFYNFFNLFNKKSTSLIEIKQNNESPIKESQTEKSQLSSIQFTINKDGEIYADVNIADYEKETISNFALLLSNLSSFRFHMEIINIVKNGFLEQEKEELFEHLLSEIIQFTQDDVKDLEKSIPNKEGDSNEDSPCIKPSDML